MREDDRFLFVKESDYNRKKVEYFSINEFPYPEELEQVWPINLHLNSLETRAGNCFLNALRLAQKSDTYNVVFCYYANADGRFTPHAIVEQCGIYFDFISNDEIAAITYYRYATVDYHAYMEIMRDKLRPDFDPQKHSYWPIALTKDGQFVIVK